MIYKMLCLSSSKGTVFRVFTSMSNTQRLFPAQQQTHGNCTCVQPSHDVVMYNCIVSPPVPTVHIFRTDLNSENSNTTWKKLIGFL